MTSEILTVAQMTAADRLTIEGGTEGYALMTEAGRGVAAVVREFFPDGRIVVLCGPGNNGGDGFVAARILKKNRMNVRLACLVSAYKLKDEAARAAAEWKEEVHSFENLKIAPDEVVVDALFGAGFKGQLEDPVADVFRQIAAQRNKVVAVDIPSGIDGSTGEASPHTLKADVTVTFFRKKLGHVLLPGQAYCGHVRTIDIGIPGAVLEKTDYAARENDPSLWKRFYRPKAGGLNKYDYGHVLIYGGMHLTGAACMASLAALRVGAGLCTIAGPLEVASVYRGYHPSVMFEPCLRPADFGERMIDGRRNAVLIGPGAGLEDEKGLRQAILETCRSGRACVFDADALSAFRDRRDALCKAISGPCVMTPHDGEFGRLFPDLGGLKTDRTLQAAKMTGAVILLKGSDTVIAAPDGRLAVNTNAPPALATGGSGDVLAGMVLGLLAQGVPAFQAACAAAWMHGDAARRFGRGLIATDIIDCIPAVLRELT